MFKKKIAARSESNSPLEIREAMFIRAKPWFSCAKATTLSLRKTHSCLDTKKAFGFVAEKMRRGDTEYEMLKNEFL